MKAGVIGAGAWGTALAQVLAADGQEVLLWALEDEVVAAINAIHANPLYLPGTPLHSSIRATFAMTDLAVCDMLLVVTPAQHLRSALAQAPAATPLILCSKGIEAGTGLLMSEVVAQIRPDAPIAVLSGPTFAHEVAAGLPTAVTLACDDADIARAIAARIARPAFRPYLSDDVIGAEIGGAVKNVLAIACGVADGAGLGLNARASLISRGFAEMTRFGLARGARAETLGGLSGLGDLVLTCSSTNSRNFSLGKGLGEGQSASVLLANRRTVAEGAFTAPGLRDAARAAGVEMPVVEAVCALLDGSAPVAQVVEALLARPLRPE
ncbi:NAD(P)H-dependent glycerol-3-phosphate dehydrogenase [Sphingobium aromaticiconvertens]|uniref:NAD(P)H-dependent glycerol-3-phosphate dehydrogenase n=1 Tax=Sphingobium aromaticiconvertens TaxID=365341 RepID=UPI00301B5D1D